MPTFPTRLELIAYLRQDWPTVILVALLFFLSSAYIFPPLSNLRRALFPPAALSSDDEPNMAAPNPSVMPPPATNLPAPKNQQFKLSDLAAFNGTRPGAPIYMSVKGTVFDVSSRADIYGPAGSYHIFAGKDGSKGLGSSSLKPEDAVSDWSTLAEKDKKVLNDWYGYFEKRYPIMGYVADVPASLRHK